MRQAVGFSGEQEKGRVDSTVGSLCISSRHHSFSGFLTRVPPVPTRAPSQASKAFCNQDEVSHQLSW